MVGDVTLSKYFQDHSAQEAVKIADKMKSENKTLKVVLTELLTAK